MKLDNIGIVVEDLPTMINFLVALGLELAGEDTVEGEWVDAVLGLQGVRSHIALLQTPDGSGKIELQCYEHPRAVPRPDAGPATLGLHRLCFSVDDIDDTVERARGHGAELMGEVVRYADLCRLCYLRGPEGVVVMLAQPLG